MARTRERRWYCSAKCAGLAKAANQKAYFSRPAILRKRRKRYYERLAEGWKPKRSNRNQTPAVRERAKLRKYARAEAKHLGISTYEVLVLWGADTGKVRKPRPPVIGHVKPPKALNHNGALCEACGVEPKRAGGPNARYCDRCLRDSLRDRERERSRKRREVCRVQAL